MTSDDAEARPRKRPALASARGGDGGVGSGRGEHGGGAGARAPGLLRGIKGPTPGLSRPGLSKPSAWSWSQHAGYSALPQLRQAEALRRVEATIKREVVVHPFYAAWQWYQSVVRGYVLRCAGFFPCSQLKCTSRTLIHMSPPAARDAADAETSSGGGTCKAAAMCNQCGTRVCGACSFKARRAVAFHAPLPCQHRVLVEACVSRIEAAMDAADVKYNAAVAASRASLHARPGRAGAAGAEGALRSSPDTQEQAKQAPELAELIELLSQLGRTEEVETLRQVQAGTYQPPAAPAKEIR
jgi:hypothetical protein